MKTSELIAELEHMKAVHGDVPCSLQTGDPDDRGPKEPILYDDFFIVAEEYPHEGVRVNLRAWPY